MRISQYDVPTAFVQAEPSRDTMVMPIPGYKRYDENGAPMYIQLEKNLYGGVESAKCFLDLMDGWLKDLGFVATEREKCLYIHPDRKIMLSLYVDDICLATKDAEQHAWIEKLLGEKFNIPAGGELHDYLGARYRKTSKGYFVDQSERIVRLASRLSVDDDEIKAPTPYRSASRAFDREKMTKDKDELQALFRRMDVDLPVLIGELLYIAKSTRPDIVTAVSELASHVAFASEEIIEAAVHVVRYLFQSKDLGIHLGSAGEGAITAWVDASFMQEMGHHGLPRYGYGIFMGDALLDWKSGHLPISATSTTVAEYHALNLCSELAVFLNDIYVEIRQLLGDYEDSATAPEVLIGRPDITVHEDNVGAVRAAKSNKNASLGTRQQAAQHWRIRQLVREGQIRIRTVESQQQIADLFTKRLSKIAFLRQRKAFVRLFGEVEA